MSFINIRNASPELQARLKRAATVRSITFAELCERLLNMHDACRAEADAGDTEMKELLQRLGLDTVVE